jgi:hypothetical protein
VRQQQPELRHRDLLTATAILRLRTMELQDQDRPAYLKSEIRVQRTTVTKKTPQRLVLIIVGSDPNIRVYARVTSLDLFRTNLTSVYIGGLMVSLSGHTAAVSSKPPCFVFAQLKRAPRRFACRFPGRTRPSPAQFSVSRTRPSRVSTSLFRLISVFTAV